jgi:exosome complex exonuclease DIS3/RRP44
LNVNSSRELADSLNLAVDPCDPMVNTVLRVMSTRSMMQAVYFCTGFESDCWHYGLAAPIYTHFTSPIRRYADIMVHRALAASIGADTTTPDILDKNHINNVCKNINFRNRMAQQAQRASIALHTQLYFRKQGARIEEAYVMQVKQNAIGVLIPQFGMEGTIFLNEIEKEAELDEENCELFIKGKFLTPAEKVTNYL